MKKRFLSIILIAAMVLSLAACGKKEDTAKTQDQTQKQSSTDSTASTDSGAKQDAKQTVSAQDIQATVNSGDVVKTNADCIVGNIPCKMP
ncbi:MAG: hypothetical protein J6U61_08815, partial [Lachnospiraceae bacterium]|nr:hypothetical protein [Lachnospiraceae bacterium]